MSSFSASDDGGVLIITLHDPGEINDFRSTTFRDALFDAVQASARPHVVLDLGPTDFLSSSGVAILVGLKRRVEARGGKLVLAHVHPSVLNLLRVMKLTQFFTFADNTPEAVTLLRPLPTA